MTILDCGTGASVQRLILLRRLARFHRIAADLNHWLIWPKVDLAIRLYLAQALFRSGAVKLASWQSAVDLAAFVYPIRFLSPAASAGLGVSVELTGAACLMLGFMTRYSATALFFLACLTQAAYRALDSNSSARLCTGGSLSPAQDPCRSTR